MFGARLAEPSSKDIIAERVLERPTPRGTRLMAIRIARPEEDPKDATVWMCTVEFRGLPGRAKVLRSAHGVDQLQALLLAINLIEHEVQALREAGHVVNWMGEPDLGLPGSGMETTPSPRKPRREKRARMSSAAGQTSRRGSPTRR
jgi:hypothetical protein